MNYIDYREKLGIGLNNSQKTNGFANSILNYMDEHSKSIYSRETYIDFCAKTGLRAIPEEVTVSFKKILKQPKGFQIVLQHFEEVKDNAKEFLLYCVVFLNSYNDDKTEKEKFKKYLFDSINTFKLDLVPVKDEDGIFLLPKGAEDLNNALISEPLEWLQDYPKTRDTFIRALKQYSNGEHVRDVADNFRKSLEAFFQEFLGNTKNLANNKTEIFKFLGAHNAEPEIVSMMQPLLNSYDKLNNSAAKHNDKMDAKYLEFLMYQTGLFIRMIITVGKEEQHDNDI